MASYTILPAQETILEKFSGGLGQGIKGLIGEKKASKKSGARQEKINKYIEALGDDYETEVSGFDEYGDPKLSAKKKKAEKSKISSDPKKAIQEALLFDENLPAIGEKMGIKESAQGFPVAGGGAVLPSGKPGDIFDPTQLQTIETPDYANLVRSALLERAQPGVPTEQATKNIFGMKEAKKSAIPEEFEAQIADIFATGEDLEDPRGELKKLIPLYAGNKEALDRIKLLISLYPEI